MDSLVDGMSIMLKPVFEVLISSFSPCHEWTSHVASKGMGHLSHNPYSAR